MLKTIGVIPSRYSSSRFPGKPLVDVLGQPMIQRVYQQACKAELLDEVIVATDDERIKNSVEEIGGKVFLTQGNHPSGTDRIWEVVEKSTHSENWNVIINIQGDEPFIQPQQIDELCEIMQGGCDIGTLIKPLESKKEFENVNRAKVVVNTKGQALYFSRSPIPYFREESELKKKLALGELFKHVGMYGYQKNILKEIVQLEPGMLEKIESLEQLRWLENGYTIQTAITKYSSLGIDTPEDLEQACKIYSQ